MPPSEGRDAISAHSSARIIPRGFNFSFRGPITVLTDWTVESGVVFHGDVTFGPGVKADNKCDLHGNSQSRGLGDIRRQGPVFVGLPTLGTTSSSVRERNSVKVSTLDIACCWETLQVSRDP